MIVKYQSNMITCIMSRHLMTHHHTRLLLWSLTAVGINEHLRCLLDVMSSVYHLLYVRVAPVLPSSSSLPLPSHCPPSALTRETQKKPRTESSAITRHPPSSIFVYFFHLTSVRSKHRQVVAAVPTHRRVEKLQWNILHLFNYHRGIFTRCRERLA